MYLVLSPSWCASQGVTARDEREMEFESVIAPAFGRFRRSKYKITPTGESKTKAPTCISPSLVRA
jgi:hypothetical protein